MGWMIPLYLFAVFGKSGMIFFFFNCLERLRWCWKYLFAWSRGYFGDLLKVIFLFFFFGRQ